MFLFENSSGESFGSVVWKYGASTLKDDVAFVVSFADVVNRAAGLFFAIFKDGFMNMASVHTFSAIRREKGRVNI